MNSKLPKPKPNTTNSELREGYIKVQLDYAPKTNGKKMREWCDKHGFAFMGIGRRAWCGSLGTYLRGASGVAYADGEPFLFYEEDLVDLEAIIASKVEEARIDELKWLLNTADELSSTDLEKWEYHHDGLPMPAINPDVAERRLASPPKERNDG